MEGAKNEEGAKAVDPRNRSSAVYRLDPTQNGGEKNSVMSMETLSKRFWGVRTSDQQKKIQEN